MTTQRDFLLRTVEKLRQFDIPFMVTGSRSSAHYGEPRATNDIDIVIDPTHEQLDCLVKSFVDDHYVSPQSAMEALANRSMFNVIDFARGWKVDFIICKDREFSRVEFARRQDSEILVGQRHFCAKLVRVRKNKQLDHMPCHSEGAPATEESAQPQEILRSSSNAAHRCPLPQDDMNEEYVALSN